MAVVLVLLKERDIMEKKVINTKLITRQFVFLQGRISFCLCLWAVRKQPHAYKGGVKYPTPLIKKIMKCSHFIRFEIET